MRTFVAAVLALAVASPVFSMPESKPVFKLPLELRLAARDGCPANTFRCPTSLGSDFSDVCCEQSQKCERDGDKKPACCPQGAVCTGVAPSMPGSAPTATVSFVSNSYFPFPFAPTSFANRGACSSALNFCSKNFDSCVTKLQGSGGGGYAVTIVAPNGGGTTVPALATGGLGAAQATSVCSSLSSQACTTAEGTKCEAYGGSSSAAKSSDAPMHWIIFMVAMIHLV